MPCCAFVSNVSDVRAHTNLIKFSQFLEVPLMDVSHKYPGYTHVALQVGSVVQVMTELANHGISITQGPVTFGGNDVSVFIRDPDRNVLELRGHDQDLTAIPGLTQYRP